MLTFQVSSYQWLLHFGFEALVADVLNAYYIVIIWKLYFTPWLLLEIKYW